MKDTLEDLAARIETLPVQGDARRLIAIAGPPGSGKSTLASALVERLGDRAALVPMDGFHYDNDVLRARNLLDRKGAPETFDVEGFACLIRRLMKPAEVAVPVFDREADLARAAARIVAAEQPIVVVEGNYLLLDLPAWRALHRLWDLSVTIAVPRAELERRLVRRWLDQGLAPKAARDRALSNDMPNADLVVRKSREADVVLGSDQTPSEATP